MREQRRIKRRKQRLLFFTILIVCFIVIIAYNFFRPLSTEAQDEPLKIVSIVVDRGESLWEIADRFDNNKMDLRRYIYLIERFNQLDTAVLQPGQRLNIPVY